jgi:glycosyltransferase involved in cell wall biosynthesis
MQVLAEHERYLRDAAESVAGPTVELSVVLPCLNEAETLGHCIETVQCVLDEHGISGEIVVADNGSHDGSSQIARQVGARVVRVTERGYGSALMGGIEAGCGQYLIIGDADDSYDFREIPKLLEPLRQGYDLVQGCRLPAGGGRVMPGAMPLVHRWVGNPLFSWLARRWFGAPVHDAYCGLRGFSRAFYDRLDMRSTGMEFAAEMIVKAGLLKAKVAEVPITLHRDGRITHGSHLRTLRDGWRTLRFFLMCCPRWLFSIPGLILMLLGAIGYAVALPGMTIGRATFDAHTLVFASLSAICGYQAIWFGACTKTFAISEGLMPPNARFIRLLNRCSLERGLLVGLLMALAGIALLLMAVNQWWVTDFGRLDYSRTMRRVVPGATLTAIGFQTVLSSFFMSILRMHRR